MEFVTVRGADLPLTIIGYFFEYTPNTLEFIKERFLYLPSRLPAAGRKNLKTYKFKMNTIKISESYNLPDSSVKKRIDSYFENIKKQNQDLVNCIFVKWNGNNAEVKLEIIGLKIKGKIELEEELITVTGELPPVAADYADKLEHIVRYELFELLN